MNEQIDNEKIIDFSAVSIFWKLWPLSVAYTHTDVGNLIGNADQSGNPGSGQGDQCSAGMFRLPEPTD